MIDKMDNGWGIYNWDAGFWPFKCQRAQAGPLSAAHDAYLHTTHVVVMWVKSCRYVIYVHLAKTIE